MMVPQVIVVTCDRLSAAVARSPHHIWPAPGDGHGRNPFSDLDLHSTFFELHYSQDVRTAAVATMSALGPPESFQRLMDRIGRAEKKVCFVTVLPDSVGRSPCSGEPSSAFLPCCQPECVVRLRELSETLAAQTDAALVWIHVKNADVDQSSGSACGLPGISADVCQALAVGPAIRLVLAWRDSLRRPEGPCAGLVLTSLQGGSRVVASPFESCFAEDAVHAPLWIDPGGGEYGRVATVTGSRDLLPTIAEWLTLSDFSEDDSMDDGERPVGSAAIDSEFRRGMLSRSLLPLCAAPGTVRQRTLHLQTNGGDALRTDDVLVVRAARPVPGASGLPDDGSGSSPGQRHESVWSLYLKPEDVWNVCDQSAVYETVLSELISLWPSEE